jgi:cellulose biosynthesis protein BcsQ
MRPQATITFDQCLPLLVRAVRESEPSVDFANLRVVRDMHGRLYLMVPDDWLDSVVDSLKEKLRNLLGHYSPGANGVARYRDTLAGEALFQEPVLVYWVDGVNVHLIERRAMGQDWALQPEALQQLHPPRFVFHSLKGGVGRSTAMMLWGRELVRQGRTVLLVDLDLEAPGLGTHMLEPDHRPSYGVLDWLVEDLVGNAPAQMSNEMVAQSTLASSPGLWVAPALGKCAFDNPENVMAKLARGYLEGENGLGFAARLRHMLEALEAHVKPDVVLIDSRAGLHETVAANLLHLNAEVFLFAVDVPATWEGYRYLLSHLAQLARVRGEVSPQEVDWRERFHMVQARASMRDEDKRRFASRSFSVWVDTLYDELPPADWVGATSAFTFDELDADAPHWPLSILRSDHFEALDPMVQLASIGESAIREAFGELFSGLNHYLALAEADIL